MQQTLPIEIWHIIFDLLDPSHHAKVSVVCRNFYTILRNRKNWTGVSISYLSQIVDDSMLATLFRTKFRSIDADAGRFRLMRLDLSFCSLLTNRAMEELSQQCEGLAGLLMQDCAQIDDRGLKALGLRCRKLETCDFSAIGLIQITDDGLEFIIEHCKDLSSLAISNCPGITKRSVLSAIAKLPIRFLDISNNKEVDDDWLLEILCAAKYLEILNVRNCAKLTKNEILKYRKDNQWISPVDGHEMEIFY